MKIAMPVNGELLNAHFGSSRAFRVYEVDEASRITTAVAEVATSGDGCSGIPAQLRAAGATLVIAGGIGQGAMANLAKHGLALVAGAPSDRCDEVIQRYLSGTLTLQANACASHDHLRHHAGHGHGHRQRHGHGHGHGHGQSCCTTSGVDARP